VIGLTDGCKKRGANRHVDEGEEAANVLRSLSGGVGVDNAQDTVNGESGRKVRQIARFHPSMDGAGERKGAEVRLSLGVGMYGDEGEVTIAEFLGEVAKLLGTRGSR
jgi:hypothetical protein